MDKIQSDEEELSAVPKPDKHFQDSTAPEEKIDNENVRKFTQDVQGQSVVSMHTPYNTFILFFFLATSSELFVYP